MNFHLPSEDFENAIDSDEDDEEEEEEEEPEEEQEEAMEEALENAVRNRVSFLAFSKDLLMPFSLLYLLVLLLYVVCFESFPLFFPSFLDFRYQSLYFLDGHLFSFCCYVCIF